MPSSEHEGKDERLTVGKMLCEVEHAVASRILAVIDALNEIVTGPYHKDRDRVVAAAHLLDFFKPKGKALVNLNFPIHPYQSPLNVPTVFEGPAQIAKEKPAIEAELEEEPTHTVITAETPRAPSRIVREEVPREIRFLPPTGADEPSPGPTLDQAQQPRRNDALRKRVTW